MMQPVEYDQTQGIVRFGYRKLTECSFLLLAIKDAAAARQWLAGAPVTSAVALTEAPQTALQIALTHEGLRSLGCTPELLAQFSMEFQTGLGSSVRARLLGDVGDSAPERWAWGAGNQTVHVLLMIYARPGELAAWKPTVRTAAWDGAFRTVSELTTSDLGGVEPFGFPDGLSQPSLDWERQRQPPGIDDTSAIQMNINAIRTVPCYVRRQPRRRCCRRRKTNPARGTLAAKAVTWCCARWSSMWKNSGILCAHNPTPTMLPSYLQRPWWVEEKTVRPWLG